jgi:hypothetical protein
MCLVEGWDIHMCVCFFFAGTAVPGAAPASSSAGEPLRPIPSRYTDISRVVERPYFDDISPRNVTAIVGQSAILNCRVKHLGDRTVSYKNIYYFSEFMQQ